MARDNSQEFTLAGLWDAITKEFADKGAKVIRGVQEERRRLVRVPQIDYVGGLVRGGAFGIGGREMSGKSLTLLEAAATVFEEGDAVLLIDAEG